MWSRIIWLGFNEYANYKISFVLQSSELVLVLHSNGQQKDHLSGPNHLPRIKTNSNNSNSRINPFSLASDLRRLLRSTSDSPETPTREHPIKNSGGDDEADDIDLNGPYNFRQLLRPTEHLPTESLRKRKGILMRERPTIPSKSISPPNQLDDSPSKRRAKPVHHRKI